MKKKIKEIYGSKNIDGLIPGIKGQRAFPTLNFRATDPFVMLDHIGPEVVGSDWFLDGKGHDHPHRGFETLTFMFEGSMQHRDSLGNRIELTSGSVQRMNAGSGIIHGGDMASDSITHRFHEMQLWVNNPKDEKMSLPLTEQVNIKWEVSSYHSSKEANYWGGGNLLQLDFKINKRLFANMRHQVFFNQKDIQNIKKYNSIMMFGLNYLIEYK